MYQVDRAEQSDKERRRRRRKWLLISFVLVSLVVAAVIFILHQLKPQTTIKQAKAVTTQAAVDNKTTHYDKPGFGIDLPSDWQVVPDQPGPYQAYRWKSAKGDQLIEVYVDTIPKNFAVNRVVIVEAQVDRLQLAGNASDNCSLFTKGLTAAPNETGVPAKWQGIDFLCDQDNQQRDVVGISSADGVNTVALRQPTTGTSHKFFVAYTSYAVSPDFSSFYSALQSLRSQ